MSFEEDEPLIYEEIKERCDEILELYRHMERANRGNRVEARLSVYFEQGFPVSFSISDRLGLGRVIHMLVLAPYENALPEKMPHVSFRIVEIGYDMILASGLEPPPGT